MNWNDILLFGQYRGERLSDVVNKDAAYLIWADQNIKNFKLDPNMLVIAEIKAESQRNDSDYGDLSYGNI